LNNDGEILAIRLAPPYDANVMCFDFKDTWYPTANTGKSLMIVSPNIPVGDLGDKASWTVGPEFAGTPDGFVITNPSDYIAWLGYHETGDGDDEDFDGFDSLAEYGLKLLPGSPDQTNGASAAPSVTTDVDGKMVFSFLLPVNALAAGGLGRSDVVYFVESSETLEEGEWSELATKEASLPWVGSGTVTMGAAAGGYVPVTVRDFVPTSAQSRRYIRLRFGLAQ
jgi:hypothetical protein